MRAVRQRSSLWILFLLGILEIQADAGVRVVLPESVTVTGEDIVLGEVARIEGTQALQDLVIGKSPRPGAGLSLPGSRIRVRILKEIPEAECEIPGILRVERAGQRISEESLKFQLGTALKEEMTEGSLHVESVRLIGRDTFDTGRLTFGPFDVSEKGRRIRGQVAVFVDDRDAGMLRFVADVERRIPVLVVSRHLERGVGIRGQDVRVEERVLSEIRGDALRDFSELEGMETRSRLAAGEVVRADHLIPSPLVRRGDKVRILVESETLTIHTLGEARRDGAEGESIPVENLRTGKVVQAEVRGPGVVRLGF